MRLHDASRAPSTPTRATTAQAPPRSNSHHGRTDRRLLIERRSARIRGARAPDAETEPSHTLTANDLASSATRALAKPSIRPEVRNAMRSARFLEHKLHLQRYVALPRAGELLRHVAAQHGISPQAILDQLDTFPELEFYIPDAAQRVTWTATESVYVYALTRDDSSTPSFVTAFDPEGRAKRASAFEEPDCTPFGRRSGMGDAVPMSSGHDATYLAQILVTKDYDPWRGSMEIEVHVEQPDGSLDCYRFEGVDEDEVTSLNTHVSHELAADTVV